MAERTRYRTSTYGSSKWAGGHNVGCVFYAPPDQCICVEFDPPKEATMPEPASERMDWDVFWIGFVTGAAAVAALLALAYLLTGE